MRPKTGAVKPISALLIQKIVAAYFIVIDTLLQGGKSSFLLKLFQLANQQLENMSKANRHIVRYVRIDEKQRLNSIFTEDREIP